MPRRAKVVAAAGKASKATKSGGNDDDAEQRAKGLESLFKDLNAKYGKGTIMKLSERPLKVARVSCGALTLDIALGGGFPKGRIVEIFGPESSGKTTLALATIAAVQREGGAAVLFDAENAFNAEYAQSMGVDLNKLHLNQTSCGEDALEMVDQTVRSSCADLIVIDSVAALTPRAELEGEMGDKLMGAQARMMSQAMRKIAGNASKHNCLVIFINQLRMKIGIVYGNPEVTTGGNALKYYCSVRVDVRRKEYIHLGGKKEAEAVGIRVKAKVVKNKVAPPHRMAEFDLLFSEGISRAHSLVDAAEKVGVVFRKGAWYSYNDENIGQGKDKTVAALKANPDLAEEIEEKTRQLMLTMHDPKSKVDLPGAGDPIGGSSDADEEVLDFSSEPEPDLDLDDTP